MGVNVFEAVEVHAESGLAAGTAGVYVPVRVGDKEVGGRGFRGFFAGFFSPDAGVLKGSLRLQRAGRSS